MLLRTNPSNLPCTLESFICSVWTHNEMNVCQVTCATVPYVGGSLRELR